MTACRMNGYVAGRPVALGLAKVLLILGRLPLIAALPTSLQDVLVRRKEVEAPKPVSDPGLWLNIGIATALVLIGGVFAGLTIALMGQVRYLFLCLLSLRHAGSDDVYPI